MNVVIVESPAKAKTINKYLGSAYHVLASYGHVRDLPAKDGSVQPDDDFAMVWDVDSQSAKRLNEIARAVKGADKLILATDPDREGEAIAWHVLQVLEQKKALKGVPVERVVFNAITKDAVLKAIGDPRTIDVPLVDAYLARRALDYLVGFTLSPVLWRKLPGSRSAGRVQSVALRIVCDRETEIESFRTQEYWSVSADLANKDGQTFRARLNSVDGDRLDKFGIPDAATAERFKRGVEEGAFSVSSIEAKDTRRNPAAPFTTSTLQQEASRKFGMSPRQTMQIAQKLYEGVDVDGETQGVITYMRTDGVQMAPEAISAARAKAARLFGDRYVSPSPRLYQTKAKNAQEAHEAIRPTSFDREPDRIARSLRDDEAKLYRLIWQRAMASQMASAEIERTTAELSAKASDGKTYGLRATGQVVRFDGFLKLYEEGLDDSDAEGDGRLPALTEGEKVETRCVEAKQHFTEPPPRYSEATLIKKLEELGIGRPSTYASTLNVLRERDYVRLEKKRLHPEDRGRLVTAFLESFFKRYVEYDFTASLEEKLDRISAGEIEWKDVLRDFWRDFTAAVSEISDLRVSEVLDALNEILGPHVFPDQGDGKDPRGCPACEAGRLSLKVGKFGAFIGCSNYPDCRFTRQLAGAAEGEAEAAPDGKVLGDDPETGLPVTLRNGRFGMYLQLGEGNGGDKPKRASIPKGYDAATMDFETALTLLALPREVGLHPESGKRIVAGFGRYGPFIEHDGKYANLPTAEEVFSVGLNRAVSLLADKAASNAALRGGTVLKELGDHPDGGAIQVLSGRFGPYVKHGKINATLPRSAPPETLTLERAIELIAEKAAKGPSKKPARGKPAAKEKSAPTSAAKPKSAAKAKTSGKPKPAAKSAPEPKPAATAKNAAKPAKAVKSAGH